MKRITQFNLILYTINENLTLLKLKLRIFDLLNYQMIMCEIQLYKNCFLVSRKR